MDKVSDNIIALRKVKKDGSIDNEIIRSLCSQFNEQNNGILPVDSVYGIASQASKYQDNEEFFEEQSHPITYLVSSFKMLDEIAVYNKLEYDFLHRIWPGEINVLLKSKSNDEKISVRMPRSRYILDLLELLGEPLVYMELQNNKGLIYEEKKILSNYSDKVSFIFIIKEFCKEHQLPSVVDVSREELIIVSEGKVPEEEIKSLYFLGADDVLE